MKFYKVLLVELSGRGDGTARLSPSKFLSQSADLAKEFADDFNARELRNPVGIWAVVATSFLSTNENAPKNKWHGGIGGTR